MMGDIVYQNKSRRFVMMLNRYVWENRHPESGKVTHHKDLACDRIRTGLHFEGVLKISSQNIATSFKEHPLELLDIEVHQLENKSYHVDFIFSGDGVIRLECEMIAAQMQDLGDSWPAKCHPKHEILDALQEEDS